MCQSHSIDFSVSRGTHGESPVCRVRASPAALNVPPKTASRIRSSPGFLFKVNPLTLARHLRVKQTSVGRSIKTTEVTFARLVPCCSDCASQLCEWPRQFFKGAPRDHDREYLCCRVRPRAGEYPQQDHNTYFYFPVSKYFENKSLREIAIENR